MRGNELPHVITTIPGPQSCAWVDRLALRECPAITARRARRAAMLGRASDDPPVFASARGSNVVDVDDNVLVDLTAGFGVALVGHANPRVVAASRRQVGILPHAMGDAFFDPRRVVLLEELAEITGLDRAILGSSGSDAVEAAIKTARVATGRDRILAFEGCYHGLSFGALAASHFNARAFRAPFLGQLGHHVSHAPFGGPIPSLEGFAAVLVEPIQGRGGMNVPPAGWLAELASRAHEAGVLVILDEIFTGLGRTGQWFMFQEEGLHPDLVCIGKGLGGGFPISACMGTAAVMDAWGASTGEAIHTQTFLGNPTGCAMALATLRVLRDRNLPARSRKIGAWFANRLLQVPGVRSVRGRGLMLGAVLSSGRLALAVSRALLRRGWILLPCGEKGEILGYSPPLTITRTLLEASALALEECIAECS